MQCMTLASTVKSRCVGTVVGSGDTNQPGEKMAKMQKGKLKKQIVVRVPDELLEALEHDAEQNGRTVAQTVRFRLGEVLQPSPA